MAFHLHDYPCAACNKNDTKFLLRKHDLNIVKCNVCGFVYVNPRVIPEELIAIYRHNYFKNKKYGYVSYEQEKRLRIKNFERWLADTKRFLPPDKNIQALDVGCAAGYCLDVMKKMGYYPEGLELDERMCEDLNAAGHHVSKQTLISFTTDNKYMLITMFDVIEHIPDVDAAFKRLNYLLEDDGILVIVTPNYSSFQRRLFKKRWFQYKPVEHIHYFTKFSLSIFAERNGFDLVYHSSCGQYADSDFILNRLRYYGFSLFAGFFKIIFFLFRVKNNFFYTDTGSLLAVFKKKPF